MGKVRITLFGKFGAERDGQALDGMDAVKVQELLSYLVLYRHRPHRREALASLFWPDVALNRAKRYLSRILWQLQRALNVEEDENEEALVVEPDWIQLNANAHIWVDVGVLETSFDRVRDVHGASLNASTAADLAKAVEAYQGDLLEGWDHEWCFFERERLQQMYLIMLDKLMLYAEAQREYQRGWAYGMRILRRDPARESTHRRLMRLLFLDGDRTGALRQYESCVGALQKELSVLPSDSTQRLHQAIQMNQIQTVRAYTAADRHEIEVPPSRLPPSAMAQLQQVQTILARIERQVQVETERSIGLTS